jgi:hypothetical protein
MKVSSESDMGVSSEKVSEEGSEESCEEGGRWWPSGGNDERGRGARVELITNRARLKSSARPSLVKCRENSFV